MKWWISNFSLNKVTLFKYKALKNIRKSKSAFNLETSNIAIWLRILIDIHEDYFKGKLKDEAEYLKEIKNTSFYSTITKDTSLNIFKKIRHYSPY